MKFFLFLLLLAPSAAFSQISWGVRGGVPLTEALEDFPGRFTFKNKPQYWVLGPTLEIRLPARLGITFDALYQRLKYEGPNGDQTGGEWTFPAMLRYRFGSGMFRPYVAGGGSFNKITGITTPRSSVTGIVVGGGAEIKLPLLRISPELRYSHKLDEDISLEGLRSRSNRVMLLVGVTF